MYCACALQFAPSEQTGSSGVQRSIVLERYSGLMVGSRLPACLLASALLGLPKTATAATWSATSGRSSSVILSITYAPCEYPLSTILVLGHCATVAWT